MAGEDSAVFTEVLELQLNPDGFSAGLEQLESEYAAFIQRMNEQNLSGADVINIGALGSVQQQLSDLTQQMTGFQKATAGILETISGTITDSVEELGKKTTSALAQIETEAGEAVSVSVASSAERVKAIYSSMETDTENQFKMAQATWEEQLQLFVMVEDQVLAHGTQVLERLSVANQNTYQQIAAFVRASSTDMDEIQAESLQFFLDVMEKRGLAWAEALDRQLVAEKATGQESLAVWKKVSEETTALIQKRDLEMAGAAGKRMAQEEKEASGTDAIQAKLLTNFIEILHKRDLEEADARGRRMQEEEKYAEEIDKIQAKILTDYVEILHKRDLEEADSRGRRMAAEDAYAEKVDALQAKMLLNFVDMLQKRDIADAESRGREMLAAERAAIQVQRTEQQQIVLKQEMAQTQETIEQSKSRTIIQAAEQVLNAQMEINQRLTELARAQAEQEEQIEIEKYQFEVKLAQNAAKEKEAALKSAQTDEARRSNPGRKPKVDPTGGILERFGGSLAETVKGLPEAIARVAAFQLEWMAVGAAIGSVMSAINGVKKAFEDGWEYLTKLEEQAAKLQPVIASSVTLSNDLATNFKMAGDAGKAVTQQFEDFSAKTGIGIDTLNSAFKSLVTNGVGNYVHNVKDAGTVTQDLVMAIVASGKDAQTTRALLSEIPKLMNGTADASSKILDILHLTPEAWQQVLKSASSNKDLVAQLAPLVANYTQEVEAARDKQQTLSEELKLTVTRVESLVAEPLWNQFKVYLQQVAEWFDKHQNQVRAIAALIGECVSGVLDLALSVGQLLGILPGVREGFSGMGDGIVSALSQTVMLVRELSMVADAIKLITDLTDPTKLIHPQAIEEEIKNLRDKAQKAAHDEDQLEKQDHDARFGTATADVNKPNEGANAPILGSVPPDPTKAKKQTGTSLDSEAFRAEMQKVMDDRNTFNQHLKTLEAEGKLTKQQAAQDEIENNNKIKDSLDQLVAKYKQKNDAATGVKATSVGKVDTKETDEVAHVKRELDKDNEAALTRAATASAQERRNAAKKELADLLQEYKDFLTEKKGEEDKYTGQQQLAVSKGEISQAQAAQNELAMAEKIRAEIIKQTDAYKKKAEAAGAKIPGSTKADPGEKVDSEGSSAIDALDKKILSDQTAINNAALADTQRVNRVKLQLIRQEAAEEDRIAKASGDSKVSIVQRENATAEAAHNMRLQEIHSELYSSTATVAQRIAAADRLFLEQTSWNNQLHLQDANIHHARLQDMQDEETAREKAAKKAIADKQGDLAKVKSHEKPGNTDSNLNAEFTVEKQILDLQKKNAQAAVDAAEAMLTFAQNAGMGSAEVQKIQEHLDQVKADADAIESKQLAGTSGGIAGRIFGDQRQGAEKTDGTSALSVAFKGFDNTAQSLAKGFNTFKNAASAVVQGYKQGGVAGAIGAGAQQVGSMVGGPWGAVISAVGSAISMIGDMFTAHARHIAEDISKAFSDTMTKYQQGESTLSATLQAVQQERMQAIQQLSGVKGGQDQLNKLLPQFDSEIAQLQKQIQDIETKFVESTHALELNNSALSDFYNTWVNINKQITDYINAGGDAATAQKFLSDSLRQQLQTATDNYNSGFQTAVQDALQLNDILQQRVDLIKQEAQSEFNIINADAIERRESGAVLAGTQLNEQRQQYQKQLDALNTQISLTQQKVDLESTIYSINMSIADLHARDNALQIAALQEQIQKAQAYKEIMQGIVVGQDGNYYMSQGLVGSTIGQITVNVNGLSTDPNALAQGIVAEIDTASRSGSNGAPYATSTGSVQ